MKWTPRQRWGFLMKRPMWKMLLLLRGCCHVESAMSLFLRAHRFRWRFARHSGLSATLRTFTSVGPWIGVSPMSFRMKHGLLINGIDRPCRGRWFKDDIAGICIIDSKWPSTSKWKRVSCCSRFQTSHVFSMGYNGRECILRALCESAQYFFKKGSNMVEELVRTVFTWVKQRARLEEGIWRSRFLADCPKRRCCRSSMKTYRITMRPIGRAGTKSSARPFIPNAVSRWSNWPWANTLLRWITCEIVLRFFE